MTIDLTFEIELLSDYHVSAGQRAGMTVDAALLRDHDRAPLLRGTALAGLLKDGLADLAALTPAGIINHQWQEAADERLFGSVARRKGWAYSSARPAGAPGRQPEETLRWGGQDVTRVRINPRTRRAAAQQLFVQEEGDARLSFRFTATCQGAGQRDVADAALLVAAARMVRHLGGARRRGRGECRLHLVDAQGFGELAQGQSWTDYGLAQFKTRWLEASSMAKAEPADVEPAREMSGRSLRFRIIAYANEPLLFARRSEAGNAYETMPFVPGTAFLGALATRAAQRMNLDPDADAPAEFIQFFVRGGVSTTGLLPAVEEPLVKELILCAPAPKALFQCENYPAYGRTADGVHTVYNAIVDSLPAGCTDDLPSGERCGGKLQPVKGYLQMGSRRDSYQPALLEEMHIRMDRDTGRASESDLYEYIALEAGQWFAGELTCDENYWQRLQALTGLRAGQATEIRLGKAARRGYGSTTLFLEKLADDPPPLAGQPIAKRMTDADQEFSLLLLTDTVAVDDWNRFYHAFDGAWLAAELGIDAENIEIRRQYASARTVDTFNTHRRMPRWRDEAVEAGSVAAVTILPEGRQQLVEQWRTHQLQEGSSEADEELTALRWALARLERRGVGLRTQEGFGRLAVNHLVLHPTDEFELSLDLDAAMAQLFGEGPVVSHPLQKLNTFQQGWQKTLDDSQQDKEDKEAWSAITAAYEPLARLLFLYRRRPIEELQSWLETGKSGRPVHLGQAGQLWGDKELLGRDKEAQIGGAGLQLISRLVDKLADAPADMQALGLKLLAERIAALVMASKAKGEDNE